MAYYEHLPIYRKAMETAIYFETIVRNFSRYNKYSLGAEMREKSWEMVKIIIKANSTGDKLPLLLELREQKFRRLFYSTAILKQNSQQMSCFLRWAGILSFMAMNNRQRLCSDLKRFQKAGAGKTHMVFRANC